MEFTNEVESEGITRRYLLTLGLSLTAVALTPAVALAETVQRGTIRKTYITETGQASPYRLYVPKQWDGRSELPAMMFLHGAWNDENQYVDADNHLMESLAETYGFLLISPLGYSKLGAYGSAMSLSSMFGNIAGQVAAKAKAEADPEKSTTLQRSENDIVSVLDRVVADYPIDKKAIFLAGHSMGAGGTWYLGNKYHSLWAAIAPLSGPFIDQANRGLDNLQQMPIFYTEGLNTPSLQESRLLYKTLSASGFNIDYKEYDADHAGMVHLALPDVFSFFKGRRVVA